MGLDQSVTLLGNVGKDAELRTTPNGNSVADFSLATNDRYNDETTWWKVTMWGKMAEALAPHIKKGIKVLVRGTMTKIVSGTYKNNAGETVVENYGITIRDFEFAGGNGQDGPADDAPAEEQDEIPF